MHAAASPAPGAATLERLPGSDDPGAAPPGRQDALGGERITFGPDGGFLRDLRSRVEEDLRSAALPSRDASLMLGKTAAIALWLIASYALLVFAATTWWEGLLCSLSLALAAGGVGFAVQHDANHGAYSGSAALNRIFGFALDLLGGSSYVWRWKHNIFHHTYPNLAGADDDIDIAPFARLAPEQPLRWGHRYQHLYMWVLYGFLAPKWHFIDDWKCIARGKIGARPFPRPRGWDLVEVIGGKLLFLGWAFVIPSLFHPLPVVLAFYAVTAFMLGVILAVVFQLAHCVEEAEFPSRGAGGRVDESWAAHQVRTTVDFARGNRLATWYLGGLNFQVEHHLFPKVCHVHYPRIARIVERTAAEHGIAYRSTERLTSALASHGRFLRRMGRAAA